jgi:hypothetical protein
MKTFKTTNDYEAMPKDVRNHLDFVLNGEHGAFDALLGGDVYLVEQVTDLTEITVDYESGGTAADTVAPLDAAEMHGDHAVFFIATNDAGGPCYFIPKWIVDSCVIVREIIRVSHETN